MMSPDIASFTHGNLMTRAAIFAPFELIEGDRRKGLLLLADHARRDLPEEYGDLGLPASEFDRHIAYDIGVETVTRALAARLGVPALLGIATLVARRRRR